MGTRIYITVQGLVYNTFRKSDDDKEMIKLFSKILSGTVEGSTFDVLYLKIAREWLEQDDVINPFKYERNFIQTVWIFDLDYDVLRYHKKDDLFSQIPLRLVRSRSVNISDFQPYELPTAPRQGSSAFLLPPYYQFHRKGLDPKRLERRRAFVSRIFADFAFQWKHVLCGRYNDQTFRKLATAIIKIATLDFNVVEVTTQRLGVYGRLIGKHQLPEWEPFKKKIIQVGEMSIVISRHLPHALVLLREHWAAAEIRSNPQQSSSLWQPRNYLIITVQEIILCRPDDYSTKYTKPERLFDGCHPPSDKALDLLLEATQPEFFTHPTHALPIKLQDLILDNVSLGPIERARIGCTLDIGSPFTWKCKGRSVVRQEDRLIRVPGFPAESHISFGEHSSGVARSEASELSRE
ncbi:hypothetical protein F4777DRAFT_599753 [Nemania sp. FL0916]|nr:hypothetical protein F4777DRAFT_599753 [Nemania sp. FL0916]